MTAPARLTISNLDFDTILSNMQNFMQSQTIFTDYNFQASGLQVLLKNLSYNTYYLAYYLNMLSNEMGISTAIVRDNINRAAKALNYVPTSMTSPSAFVNITVTPPPNTVNVGATLTLPQYTPFQSQSINGQNFTYVTTSAYISSYANGTFLFSNVQINEGEVITYQYTASTLNPRNTFNIPNANIDTTTLMVNVVENTPSPPVTMIYQLSDDVSLLTGNSRVYFLEGATSNTYNIYFGDGILGRALIPGDVATLYYLNTYGSLSNGANSFTIMSPIGGYSNVVLQFVSGSSGGGSAETDDSIKQNAPLAYSTQNRAVTEADYAFLLNQNYNNIGSLNVWGGGDNIPPVYGSVFISIRPLYGNYLTTLQKQQVINIINNYILPGTVIPQIIDPDYTYILPTVDVVYNPNLTNLSSNQLISLIQQAIYNYSSTTLNKFNSVYMESALSNAVIASEPSIQGCDIDIYLQKRIFPILNSSVTYTLNYYTPLYEGNINDGLYTSPGLILYDNYGNQQICFIEENSESVQGIYGINVSNPGFLYSGQPQIIITGDGQGAAAHAIIVNGSLQSIVMDNNGYGYSYASATVAGGGGYGAIITPVLNSQIGTLDTYYYTSTNKIILNSNQGTVNHILGTITLNNLNVIGIQNQNGQFNVNIKPASNIILPNQQNILLIDPTDPLAVTVNLIPVIT